MGNLERRLEKVVEGSGPEETARFFIEGPFLGMEVPPAEQRRLIDRMTPEQGRQYNRFLDRSAVLKDNLRLLLSMVADLRIKLLERDRTLWYWRAVEDLQEQLLFGDAAKALLTENANLRPGKPFRLRTLTGWVELGVWGKRRSQFGPEMRSRDPRYEEILDIYAQGIRGMAAEVKAVERWVREEAHCRTSLVLAVARNNSLAPWGHLPMQLACSS